MKLHSVQLDRAIGAVLASAAGDALGAGYEFDRVRPGPEGPRMIGGGLGAFEVGEWTDDTTMTWGILDVAATGADLRTPAALTEIAQRFKRWADSRPRDIGNQTRAVLRGVRPDVDAAELAAAAEWVLSDSGSGGGEGNGSLMRTAPVVLAHLDDATALAEAARKVSSLTHPGALSQEACVLWCLAIRHAVLTGELDVRVGLAQLDPDRRGYWRDRIAEAEEREPESFHRNGFVVTAFQAAWSAIHHTPVPADRPACEHVQDALARAIGIGHDTDTVAAIAGALLGARWGESAVPAEWRRVLHGYPGITGADLSALAYRALKRPVPGHWPDVDRVDHDRGVAKALVRHPFDDGVWLGDGTQLDHLPDGVGAVVSMVRVGRTQIAAGVERVGFRLIDEPASNDNLDFVLRDIGRTVAKLRDEGKVVFVHCAAAQSRTPAAAIAYALERGHSYDEARRAVLAALPQPNLRDEFDRALARLDEHRA